MDIKLKNSKIVGREPEVPGHDLSDDGQPLGHTEHPQ